MNGYKIDLYLNKKSSDGSIMEKVHDYKLQLQEHEENGLNILKKSPLCSACEREVRILDRYSGEKFKALMFGSNNYLGATVNNIAPK